MHKDAHHPVGIEAFAGCPPSELWRCLVSRNRQAGVCEGINAKGPLSHDSVEKGYLQGVFSGLEFILEKLESKKPVTLDADFLLALHKSTTSNVFEEVPIENELNTKLVPIDHDYRDVTGTGFRINIDQNNPGNNATPAGIRELVEEFKEGYTCFVKITAVKSELSSETEILHALDNGDVVAIESRALPDLSPTQIRQSVIDQVNKIFLLYQKLPKSTEEEILKSTAIIVRLLEVFHPFKDANCRTLNLLRQFILAQNGVSPRILTNNDRIDAYSINELVEEMKKGKVIFSNITNGLSDHEQFNIINESGHSHYQRLNQQYHNSYSCPIGGKPALCKLVSMHLLKQITDFNGLHHKKQEAISQQLSSQLIAQNSWTPAQLTQLKQAYAKYCKPIVPLWFIKTHSNQIMKIKKDNVHATQPQGNHL